MAKDWKFSHILTVKSSAGAGKTYNLALRYLQLLLLDKSIDTPVKNWVPNIVAITFTNKTASEMRSRIIDWMKRIILDIPFKNSDKKPINEIKKSISIIDVTNNKIKNIEFVKLTESEISKTIRENFEALLKNYHNFKVGTIDSFVNLILKASAFKLNLPPDFDIVIESSFYIEIVLQEILQKILEDKNIKAKFDNFLENYIEIEGKDVKWIPKSFLRNIISKFWEEETKENKEFISTFNIKMVENIQEEIKKNFIKILTYLKTDKGIKADKKFIFALENFLNAKKFELKDSKYYIKQTLHECLNKGSAVPDEEYERLWKNTLKLFSSFVESISESKFSSYIDIYNLFKKNLKKEITYRRKIILIEELNKLLQEIIHSKSFIPEIYYALAERYFHFLIDEFQDTNHLQWKNIEILIEEALSKGGTLFLVGDKKQAIYRWRGGKSELVDEVIEKNQSSPIYELNLDTNFRSSEYIVKFNNIVFNPKNIRTLIEIVMKENLTSNKEKVLQTYKNSTQKFLESKKDQGYVYIEKIIKRNDNGEFQDTFLKQERNEIIKEKFIKLIQQIRARNVFQNKDIAVLVRKREEAEIIVKALLEIGISVESEFTVNVKNNPLIKEIISFLQFINSPDDDLSFAGFITGKIFQQKTKISKDEIFKWMTENKIKNSSIYSLYKIFRNDYPEIWDTHFEIFFKNAGYLPLYEFIILLLKKWDVLQNFPEDAIYFLHICEIIKQREGIGENNFTSFLQFWNKEVGEPYGLSLSPTANPFLLKTTEGANAVKVLTIHKAKGLEFPVVILPFLKINTFPPPDNKDKAQFFFSERDNLKLLYIKKNFINYSQHLKHLYLEKEMEYLIDELNNMYVAFTRAEKELYILLTDSSPRYKNYLIDYIFNIEELKKYKKNNETIEIGKKYEKSSISSNIISEDKLIFDDIGNDIKWMEKIKTKLEEPLKVSKNQIFAKRKGDVVHYILSLIDRLPDDYDKFLDECIAIGIAKFNFHSYKEEIKHIIFSFFENSDFKKFFLPGKNEIVYTEKEIVGTDGEVYKVDRIIISNEHIDVIDFKTGETHSPEHIKQITNYANLLKKIYPDKSIRKYLLYIDENEVKIVV